MLFSSYCSNAKDIHQRQGSGCARPSLDTQQRDRLFLHWPRITESCFQQGSSLSRYTRPPQTKLCYTGTKTPSAAGEGKGVYPKRSSYKPHRALRTTNLHQSIWKSSNTAQVLWSHTHWFPSGDATNSVKKWKLSHEVLHVCEATAAPGPPDHVIPFISHVGHSFAEHILRVLEKEAANKANDPQMPPPLPEKSTYVSHLSKFDTETVFLLERKMKRRKQLSVTITLLLQAFFLNS